MSFHAILQCKKYQNAAGAVISGTLQCNVGKGTSDAVGMRENENT